MFTHESTSFLDCVIEGNGRNEGKVHFIPYRALHAGRTALIGRHRRMSPDYTSDEMAFVAVTPDHIDVLSLHAVFSFFFFFFFFFLFIISFYYYLFYLLYFILF